MAGRTMQDTAHTCVRTYANMKNPQKIRRKSHPGSWGGEREAGSRRGLSVRGCDKDKRDERYEESVLAGLCDLFINSITIVTTEVASLACSTRSLKAL